MPGPVDIERLEAFCDGTAAGLRAVVDIFLTDTLETLTELDRAVARADLDTVHLLAHRAGGSSAACGAGSLAGLLGRIEMSGSLEEADVPGLIHDVLDEFGVVTRFLQAYVEGLPA
jgi:HPt (histidine-containing phosphotransfer) domain-containing protein